MTATITKGKLDKIIKKGKKPDKDANDREAFERSKKPPKDGPCKGCGKDRPLNRLFLCYPCWVKSENEKGGWREGQPHPDGCGCDLDCKLDAQGGQN